MSKLVLSFLAITVVGCGNYTFEGRNAGGLPTARSHEMNRYSDIVEVALDSYEEEVRTAAAATYGSRSEAHAKADELAGTERWAHHMRRALEADGLTVADLCQFSKDHPFFAEWQAGVFGDRIDELVAVAISVAQATVDPSMVVAETLPADSVEDASGLLTLAR